MAAAILRTKLTRQMVEGVRVSSAGLLQGGAPATAPARATVGGLADHVSRQVVHGDVRAADLILCLARLHLREVVVLAPDAFHRTFTLKEFVRRGTAVGPVPPGVSLTAWLDQIGEGRSVRDLLGDSANDDVADPIGRSLSVYRRTANELETLIECLFGLLWKHGRG